MKHVLLVEDETALLDTMVRSLMRYNKEFHILTARNGAEAIEVLKNNHVDFISVDLNMPILNGFHLLVYILKECPNVAVLVTTAFDISTMQERISQRGFKSITYLQKPFSLKYFTAIIRHQLKESINHTDGINLLSILQLLQLEQKTCSLRIYSVHGEGNLSFVDGELVHAWSNDTIGMEAIHEIIGWEDIHVEVRDIPISHHHTIDLPLSTIIEECIQLQKEKQASIEMEELSPQQQTNTINSITEIADIEDQGSEINISLPISIIDDNDPQLISDSIKDIDMSNVKQSLDEAMTIDGAVGVALVDFQSGMSLGNAGGNGFNLEIAAAGNTDVVRSKLKVMSALGLKDTIEDILITLGQQYHIIRLLKSSPGLFLYLVLSKSQANLAMARHKLAQIEGNLSV